MSIDFEKRCSEGYYMTIATTSALNEYVASTIFYLYHKFDFVDQKERRKFIVI